MKRPIITWILPVAGFVGFTLADALVSRWEHRNEPPNIYNTRKTYGGAWRNQ